MRGPIDLSRTSIIVSTSVLAVVILGLLLAWEPITRNVVSVDAWCVYCHGDREYLPSARMSFSKVHPNEPEEGVEPVTCIGCHMPEGILASTYAYTHYLSATDLLGHFRDREGERSGDWIPMSAARAYRVRERLFEYDSVTCRGCHDFDNIKPKKKRGQRSHDRAVENKETCIECHNNLVHRYIEVRDDAFSSAETAEEEEDS